jgi:hypothetical protein
MEMQTEHAGNNGRREQDTSGRGLPDLTRQQDDA